MAARLLIALMLSGCSSPNSLTTVAITNSRSTWAAAKSPCAAMVPARLLIARSVSRSVPPKSARRPLTTSSCSRRASARLPCAPNVTASFPIAFRVSGCRSPRCRHRPSTTFSSSCRAAISRPCAHRQSARSSMAVKVSGWSSPSAKRLSVTRRACASQGPSISLIASAQTRPNLIEIYGQGRANGLRQQCHMPVIRMVETGDYLSTRRLEPRDLTRGERKLDELDRRGFAFGAGVLARRIGFASDAFPGDIEKDVVFDPAQPHQHRIAAPRVVDLEHHRRNQVAALRDERIVCGELVFELCIPALLDVQHLLHLIPHSIVVLEIECRKGADFEPALLLDLGDPFALRTSNVGIFGERQDIVARQ